MLSCSSVGARPLHRGIYRVQHASGHHRDLTIVLEKPSETNLKIILSDDVDPCFLCVLIITRTDYEEIKKLQGLLVDFDSFPAQFTRLLQQCECGNMFLSLHQDGPLNVYLEVIERNEFKRLVHLSLKTVPATDSDIKKNMAEHILMLRKTLSDANTNLSAKETVFQEKEQFLEMRINDLSTCLARVNEEKLQRENEHLDILRKEKERFEQEKLEWKKYADINSKTQTSSMQEALARKERQLEDASSRCQKLQDTIKHLESQINDKTQRMFVVEKQLHTARLDAESWRNQNDLLDRDFHDRDHNLQQVKTQLHETERLLKEKTDLLRDTLDTLSSLKKEKVAFQEKANNYETMSTKRYLEVQNINEQLLKANQIIAKQNTDILEYRKKVKCRTAIVLEQEKVINSSVNELPKFQQKEKELLDQIENQKKEHEHLRNEMEMAKITIKEKGDIINRNNSVIQWLQKKVDALQSVTDLAASASYRPSSTPYTQPNTANDKSDTDDNDNRLSNLYIAGSRGGNLLSTTSLSQINTHDNLMRTGSAANEEYSVNSVYLKPSGYQNSDRTTSRSKSQDSLGKKSYTPLPDVNVIKDSQKISEKSRIKSSATDHSKKSKSETRYLTSGISAYFPKP